ncbi:MAG: hypothetical protein Q8P56_04810 [Candidatus Uhrbacteria bacterium]|nr:hypothetical protein [Candidatus Uhrbacteria bacterium]
MLTRFWDAVAFAAGMLKAGHGAKGRKIYREVKREYHCGPDEAAQVVDELRFKTRKKPNGDYYVSNRSGYFPSPMKLDDNTDN